MSLSYSQLSSSPKTTFTLWTGYFFSINVVVGAGFLTLPYVFHRAGWLFSSAYMIFTAFVCYFIAAQLIEVMSRAEIILRMREEGYKIDKPSFKELFLGRKCEGSILLKESYTPQITDRRIDVSESMRIIFGNVHGALYVFMLYFYFQGAQTAYTSIFASSFAANIPLYTSSCDISKQDGFINDCRFNYWTFLLIYGCAMMFLTIKGMQEQKWLQVTLTFMRFLIMSMVIFTALALIITKDQIDGGGGHSPDMGSPMNPEHAPNALSAILFAFVYQLQLPSIIEFVQDREKSLPRIIMMVTATCMFFYLSLGLIVPAAVDSPESLVTLNYKDYTGGYSERYWWAYIIGYLIVLFPAADVFSSFPLMAIPLSDNLITITFGTSAQERIERKKVVGFRVLCVSLPLFAAFIESDLGVIITVTGLFGFYLVPIAIPLMHIGSRVMVPQKGPYDVKFSPVWLSWLIIIFSIGILFYSIIELIIYL